jgi:hypothetical protein
MAAEQDYGLGDAPPWHSRAAALAKRKGGANLAPCGIRCGMVN